MDLNQNSDQMEMFGYTAEGAQQEADKFVGEDKKPKTGLRTVSLDDIKEEERDRVRAEYKLNDESFSFRNLYNKIPTNARLLIENVLGKDSDITEKNFTNDELIEMILLAEKQEENFRNVRNRKFKNQPENVTTVSPYFRDPDAKGVTTRVDESYKDSLIRTFTDPQYRVATSLGRFDVEKNPSGLRITDEYDFNKVQRDLPTDLKGILRHIRYSPELAGEYLANLLDTPSREVNINIPKKMFKGGAVMEDQMEMAFMNEGGIADDGMDVDPVSGNEVPPGSLAEEVRDDIPAQLSEGEYVVPADVVRYYGVKFFEDLRDQAKMGLADMEANGRIGGEPVPDGGPINDQELSPQEMQAIQEMMGMAEGGEVQNPYLQQQQLYSQPRPAPIDEKRNTTITNVNPVENQMPMQSMADGGQVQGYQDSSVVMQDAPSFVQNQFNPAQYGLGFSFMGQPQQTGTTGTTTSQAPQGQTFTVLYHPDYATNGRSKTFYLPRDNEIYQEYLGRGYTKQMPMTGPAGQGETPTTDTPVTTDLTGAKVTTGSRRGPKGSTPTPEKVDYSTYDGEQLLEAFDKNRKTRIALTALGAVNPMIALFGQGATRAQEKEIIAAMDKLGIKPPENEATVLDNITDFVSGLFGKDKEEVKTNVVQQSKPEPEPVSTPTGTGISLTPPTDPKRKSLDVRRAEAQTRIDAKKRRDKRKAAIDKGKKILSKSKSSKKPTLSGKGAKAVSATQKAGPFNEGGLMNKKGDK